MKNVIIYIHGKGGTAEEAEHYRSIFANTDVVGFDYKAQTPWEAKKEFPQYFDAVCAKYETVWVLANSIGAFFAMSALADKRIGKAMFVSPIVNMERLICDMMAWEHITEAELRAKKEIETAHGEILSWAYLCYVRAHPVKWTVPTEILYGGNDRLTSYQTLLRFAKETGAVVTGLLKGK